MAAAIYSIVLVYKFCVNIKKRVSVKKRSSSATRNNDVETLKKSLLEAIRDDDIQILKCLLSTNPEILDLAATDWSENPIIKACKLRSFRVVEEIRIRKPEFARLKDDGDGCSLLHSACIRGDVEMVRVLLGLDSQLCFVPDMYYFSFIPLHTAVIHGHLDVIKALLSASLESLGALTSLDQTVFHLAASYHRSDAFAVLLEEAKPPLRKHLLYQVDHQGNTALDIAVTNKLFPIEKLLLSMNCDSVDVSLNTREIAPNLHEAESEDGFLIEDQIILPSYRYPISVSNSPWWLLKKKKFKLIFPAILIALGFGITLVLPYFFPREKSGPNQVVFQFRDVVFGQLPPVFYIMTLITIVFTASTINLSMLLLSLPCGSLLFLCGISILVLYVLLANCIMPKFFVTFGSDHVSSYWIMWTLSLGLVFFGALIILLVKCFHLLSLRILRLMIILLSKLRWYVVWHISNQPIVRHCQVETVPMTDLQLQATHIL